MGKHTKGPDGPEPPYEVGYKKPPEEHRFKLGHKGNGKRRKKKIDLNQMIAKSLSRNVTIPVEGEPQTMQRIEAIVDRLTLQLANNPAKHLKANLPLINGALTALALAAGCDETGIDYAAEFRKRIERMAERRRLYADGDGEDEVSSDKSEA